MQSNVWLQALKIIHTVHLNEYESGMTRVFECCEVL